MTTFKKNEKSHALEGAWIASHRLYPAPRSWLPYSSSREMVMYWQRGNRFKHLGKFNNIALGCVFTVVTDFSCSNHLSHFICFMSFHLRLKSEINLPNLPLKQVNLGYSFLCPWFFNISHIISKFSFILSYYSCYDKSRTKIEISIANGYMRQEDSHYSATILIPSVWNL